MNFDGTYFLKEFPMAAKFADPAAMKLAEERLSVAALAFAKITGTSASYGQVAGIVVDAMSRLETQALANPGVPFNPDMALSGPILTAVGARIEEIKMATQQRPENMFGPGAASDKTQDEMRPKFGVSELLLKGKFGADRYADGYSGGGGRDASRSALYAQEGLPGAKTSGEMDLRGITPQSFYNSPFTRGIAATGMNYGTFDYLRHQGFDRKNITNAANDAKALGFGPNDKPAVRDHAIIDKHDPKARESNEHLRAFRKGVQESQAFQDAKAELRNARTKEQKAAAWAKINKVAKDEADKHGVTKDMLDREKPHIAREALGRRKDATVKHEVESAVGAKSDAKPDIAESKAGADLFKQMTGNTKKPKGSAPVAPQTATPKGPS